MLEAVHYIVMEITLLITENHGIVLLNFCGNPDKPTSDATECSLTSDLLCQDIMIDGNRTVHAVTLENI